MRTTILRERKKIFSPVGVHIGWAFRFESLSNYGEMHWQAMLFPSVGGFYPAFRSALVNQGEEFSTFEDAEKETIRQYLVHNSMLV